MPAGVPENSPKPPTISHSPTAQRNHKERTSTIERVRDGRASDGRRRPPRSARRSVPRFARFPHAPACVRRFLFRCVRVGIARFARCALGMVWSPIRAPALGGARCPVWGAAPPRPSGYAGRPLYRGDSVLPRGLLAARLPRVACLRFAPVQPPPGGASKFASAPPVRRIVRLGAHSFNF